MKRRLVGVGCCLLVLILALSILGSAASTPPRFKLGDTIEFRVEDTTIWWWWNSCCSCDATTILGWRITDGTGLTIYSVVNDVPVASPAWLGTWNQVNSDGVAVTAGSYMLYVDTSAGTLSRCFTLYDACGCGCYSYYYSPCSTCGCQEVATVTNCACQTSLKFIEPCTTGCFSFFWWLGCGCSSGCP